MATNGIFLGETIKHQIELERLKDTATLIADHQLRQDILNKITTKTQNTLNNLAIKIRESGLTDTVSLQRLSAQIDGITKKGYTGLFKETKKGLIELSITEAKIAKGQLAIAIPGEAISAANIGIPSRQIINDIVNNRTFEGRTVKQWFQNLASTANADIKNQINIGLANGETPEQIRRRLTGRGAAYSKVRRNLDAVVRTSMQHVNQQTRNETFKANESFIKKVQWVSVLDFRTTPICQDLDGQIFPTNKGPRPPIHFQCRSNVVPIISDWKDFGLKDPTPGTRASLNGQVAEDLTYEQWLKTQSVAGQNQALGKTKARLFREGKISIEDTINQRGDPLTLEQIRERNNLTKKDIEIK